jgi:translation initiation factor IF-3
MPKQKKQDTNRYYRVNDKIRFSPVMVIDQNGQNLGSMSVEEAKKRARMVSLDLVEVGANARPPVCKIMDFGKFRYDQNIKEKKQKSKQKSMVPKEVRLSPRIAEHDILTKERIVRKFLENGQKVHLRLEYKKRENVHKDLGLEVMQKVISDLEDVGKAFKKPEIEGRFLNCFLEPKT